MKKGPYKVLSSKVVYRNPWIEVKEDKVENSDGKEGIFGTVDYGEGVTIVAVNEKNDTYLIKEYYYVLDEYGVQTPSGGVGKDEAPLTAAKKELLEEAGLVAKKWISLGKINCLTTIIRAPQHLFLAQDIEERVKTESEIEVIKVPFIEAYQKVIDSEITYAPICVAILKAKIYLDSKK